MAKRRTTSTARLGKGATHPRPVNRGTQHLLNKSDCDRLRRLAHAMLKDFFPTLDKRGGYADVALNEAVASAQVYFQTHVANDCEHPYSIAARAIRNQLSDLCNKFLRDHRSSLKTVHLLKDEPGLPEHEPADSNAPAELDRLIELETLAAIPKLLDLLRPQHREVIDLRYYKGLSAVKAATIMKVSECSFNRLHREALRDLRRLETNPAARQLRAQELENDQR